MYKQKHESQGQANIHKQYYLNALCRDHSKTISCFANCQYFAYERMILTISFDVLVHIVNIYLHSHWFVTFAIYASFNESHFLVKVLHL